MKKNDQFCIFIVKKCHSPCDSYAFSSFKWKSFPFGFTFSFDNFIRIIKKYHFPCDFDALFFIFLTIFVFHLICKYIFFHRDFKGKSNYKYGCIRQILQFKCYQNTPNLDAFNLVKTCFLTSVLTWERLRFTFQTIPICWTHTFQLYSTFKNASFL